MTTHQHHNLDSGWTCAQVQDEIEAWSIGALDRAEAAAVDRHLAWCPNCRQEATRWQTVASMLPLSLPPATPSASTRRALMARIADDQMESQQSIPTPRDPAPAPPAHSSPPAPAGQRRIHWSQVTVAPLAIALLVMTLWSFQLRDQLNSVEASLADSSSAGMPEHLLSFQMQSDCEQCDTAGRLLADPERTEALMVAWNLDPGEVREVWCEEENGKRQLVANLQADNAGEAVQSLSFERPIAGYERILVVSQNGEVVEIRLGDRIGHTSLPTKVPIGLQ